MSYFLSNQILSPGSQATLEGQEASHILLSRRIKKGEQIFIQDQKGKRYGAEVVEAGRDYLKLAIGQAVAVPAELSVRITLFQSVISEKALDFVFQKVTELGAAGITLFNSQNTATKLSSDQFQKKHERWNKILWEAAKQSGRGQVPELKFLPSIDNIAAEAKRFDQIFIFDATGKGLQIKHTGYKPIALVVGPEGGLTQYEFDQLSTLPGSQLVSVSPFTLRAETAAVAGLSIIQHQI